MRRFSLPVLLIVAALALPAAAASPLEVKVRRVDSNAFPLVTALFEIYDADGACVRGVHPNQINASENDEYLRHIRVESAGERTNVVFVLDNSPKMKDHFNELKQDFHDIVHLLGEGDRSGVVFLRGKPKVMQPLTKDRFKTISTMGSIGRTGHNDTYTGLDRAFDMLKSVDGAREIVLITCTMPDVAKICRAQYRIYLELTHKLRMHGIRLHAIGLGHDALDDDTMQRLCDETGGLKLVSPNPYELKHVFTQILYGVPAAYRLSYISPQGRPVSCPYKLEIFANSDLGAGSGAIRFRP